LKKYAFSIENYRRSQDEYVEQWQTLDDCLYRLCHENPTHDSRLSVNAKAYIIGRTYQTGIERQVRSKGTQGSSMSQVADLLYTRRKELDPLFARLARTSEPLIASNSAEIIEIHGRITNLLAEITINGDSPRSFVAKYMHFHNRVAPIYDANAAEVVWSLVPERSIQGDGITVPKVADLYFPGYVRRLLSLYDSIATNNVPVSVRSLDYYLVWEHDRLVSGPLTENNISDATTLKLSNEELKANG